MARRRLEPPWPELGAAFAAWLAEEGRTGAEIAELCGVSATSVSQWRHGITRPSGANREILSELGCSVWD